MIGITTGLDTIEHLIGGDWAGDTSLLAVSEPVRFLAYDTRKILHPKETLFVALNSGKRDGHQFVQAAYDRGVRFFILEKKEVLPSGGLALIVPNTLQALQNLARKRRETHSATFVGITGSNGKTIVKEWLRQLLEGSREVGGSPGSFNSQLGVALSLLQIPEAAEVALVEAGVSQPGEMEGLAKMIQPNVGIMTHFGDAHAEGFSDPAAKLLEKRTLFSGVEVVLAGSDDLKVVEALRQLGRSIKTIGRSEDATIQVLGVEKYGGREKICLQEDKVKVEINWHLSSDAAHENMLIVVLAARHFGLDWKSIQDRLAGLHPVSMRMEMLTDNPEITIINDAYNADRDSVLNALTQLVQSDFQAGHALVLSDMEHQGRQQENIQRGLLEQAIKQLGAGDIFLVGPVYEKIAQDHPQVSAFSDVDAMVDQFDYHPFKNKTVLLKGARRYQLERLIPYLSRRATATYFKINLDHLRRNLQQFRSQLTVGTKVMAMVKAFAYGAGDWEVARILVEEGIDYLAVAYTSAGIALRTRGVTTPILVMNADPATLAQLYRFGLEPVVYGFDFLLDYLRVGRSLQRDSCPLHIEVDTGMGRLGFAQEEVTTLLDCLGQHPEASVKSVLSHFSMADDPACDDHTHGQAIRYQDFADALEAGLVTSPLRHLANTAGIMRFPAYHFDMVRLGLGLYGISPLGEETLELRELGSLHTQVTQVHAYAAGQPIGYGGASVTSRSSRVATIPIGYADGIRRSLSNGKMAFLVRGKRAPIIGRVCMDMLMLDVTEIPEVQKGDEVVLLGGQGDDFISVKEMAKAAETIPYEVLVNIGQRVRRIYEQE